MESSKPSGAQQPQLPAAGAQRRRQHLSWPRSMRRCHARQWLAAELQPAHEPRRRQSAAVRASAVKRGRLRGVAAATTGALSTNRDILYFLMLSCYITNLHAAPVDSGACPRRRQRRVGPCGVAEGSGYAFTPGIGSLGRSAALAGATQPPPQSPINMRIHSQPTGTPWGARRTGRYPESVSAPWSAPRCTAPEPLRAGEWCKAIAG